MAGPRHTSLGRHVENKHPVYRKSRPENGRPERPRTHTEERMTLRDALYLTVAAAAFLAAVPAAAQQVGDTDIGGVVRSPGGPEAGVWVIAETTDLPTKLAK